MMSGEPTIAKLWWGTWKGGTNITQVTMDPPLINNAKLVVWSWWNVITFTAHHTNRAATLKRISTRMTEFITDNMKAAINRHYHTSCITELNAPLTPDWPNYSPEFKTGNILSSSSVRIFSLAICKHSIFVCFGIGKWQDTLSWNSQALQISQRLSVRHFNGDRE